MRYEEGGNIFYEEETEPHCYVCQKICEGKYFVTFWGNVCQKCYQPKWQCVSCGKQLREKEILKLADNRIICSECFATAVFQIRDDIISSVLSKLAKFGIKIEKPISYKVIDLLELKKSQARKIGRKQN